MWYWWYDDRDQIWHLWQGTPPGPGDQSACTARNFDGSHCRQQSDDHSKGRCDACRQSVFQ